MPTLGKGREAAGKRGWGGEGRTRGGGRLANVEGGRNVRIITENPVESVAPRGRKTGPADKNHSRCVTYCFECDGRRSPAILPLSTLLPRSSPPRTRAPYSSPPSRLSRSLGSSRSSLSRRISLVRAIYKPHHRHDLIRANFKTSVKYPP